MNGLEQKLSSLRLAEPSADLDRRMAAAFLSAGRTRKRSPKAVFWWPLAAMAAAGVMTALLVVAPRRSGPAPQTVVYQLAAQGRMRQMLLNPAPSRDGLPRLVVRVEPP